ncbi:PREDICTED: bis(5'-nucleosyl)-tetraphosphatase [asymmetrical] isoform X2 [Ceratosolen solmsi marchali]|uniref:Bis(5'-nucleosyl)-tetraphosphatase [asymmetrical] n=1 Tax=Ceratosolen solmsi marchali TaxID=326594 RepID=A0AAJ6VKH4_9HYME|nr:PREDICTED: bis(5'-nucleosyl)-tetraphosphatase [asymmetrical] isoform X2 [Ceratosolen solmsi marchali]
MRLFYPSVKMYTFNNNLLNGRVDPGETDMITALRETKEEAGYLKEDMKIFESVKQEISYLVDKKPKVVVYWLAEILNKNKEVTLSHEHQDFKWLTLEDACNLAVYPEMQNILKYFDKYISENVL